MSGELPNQASIKPDYGKYVIQNLFKSHGNIVRRSKRRKTGASSDSTNIIVDECQNFNSQILVTAKLKVT